MIINKRKKIIIISIIIILLFLITILLVKLGQEKKRQQHIQEETARVKQYTSIQEFKNMEEVALYLNCTFIKQEEVQDSNINYNVYMKLPEEVCSNKAENRTFFENLIQYSAHALDYKNFCIIDEKNNTKVLVECNHDNKTVNAYSIDGVVNYFEKQQNTENMNNLKQIKPINIEITSQQLKQIISNSWSTNNVNLGTPESTYRNYDVYFDEGYQIRKVDGKVFNIVFTSKYSDNVVSNLKVSSSKDEIKKILGQPQFEDGDLIGYKGNDIYVFFNKSQISIYRKEKYGLDEITPIIEKYKSNMDSKAFIEELKSTWKDYDVFTYNQNSEKLQYTLKGIVVKFDSSSQKGLVVFNNYEGNVLQNLTIANIVETKQTLPDFVFFENSDLVFEAEKERVNTLDDTTGNNNYSSKIVLNTSNSFKTYKSKLSNDSEYYKIRFISINEQYPNSELREVINYGIWADDYNFIYSVKNRGIYVYNAQTRTYKTIKTGTNTFRIIGLENNTLYYDNETLKISL